jgi:hypothetical protein
VGSFVSIDKKVEIKISDSGNGIAKISSEPFRQICGVSNLVHKCDSNDLGTVSSVAMQRELLGGVVCTKTGNEIICSLQPAYKYNKDFDRRRLSAKQPNSP